MMADKPFDFGSFEDAHAKEQEQTTHRNIALHLKMHYDSLLLAGFGSEQAMRLATARAVVLMKYTLGVYTPPGGGAS